MEQYGTMEVVNNQNGLKAVLTFKPAGWASKDLHRVEGVIMDKKWVFLSNIYVLEIFPIGFCVIIMCYHFFSISKKKLQFIYGKWTEFIKSTDYDSYEDYVKENSHKFKNDKSKSPNESPAHTPRKVLSKLNSLKMSSFRSLSIQDVSLSP